MKIQNEKLNEYYADNGRKIRRIVDGLLACFGGLSDKDVDDFYSLANEVFVVALAEYSDDKNCTFDTFFQALLKNNIKSEITARNRIKRTCDRIAEPLDKPVTEDGEVLLMDTIIGSPSPEDLLTGGISEKTEAYLEKLTRKNRQICECIMAGLSQEQTMVKLDIGHKEFRKRMKELRSYENVSILLGGI